MNMIQLKCLMSGIYHYTQMIWEKIVNCPQCGKELPYGETYTSKEIHNWVGLGYGVCEECYEKECERRKKYRTD